MAQAGRYAACHLLGRIYMLHPAARARARLSRRAARNLAATFSEPFASYDVLLDGLRLTEVPQGIHALRLLFKPYTPLLCY